MTASNIFAFWTGDNDMPVIRRHCLESFSVTGLDPVLVSADNLDQWVVAGHRLHPAYDYLSAVHRSDYLRPYFMFHHGGGYADIKRQTGSWLAAIEQVNRSSWLLGAGYREVRGGTVHLHHHKIDGRPYILSRPVPGLAAKAATNLMRAARPLLIGNCAFYFKQGGSFTRRWLGEVERRLDQMLPDLRAHPARHPRDRQGDESGYPLPWSYLQGDVMGPLSTLYWPRLLRSLPRPIFTDYGA